jgi:peptidyl-prolyl cis-trans isomerase D
MFEFLRKLIFPIIIVVLVFFVAMIILQWGADITRSKRTDNVVGVIDGDKITYDQFDQYYRMLLRQEQENTDYDISDKRMAELRDKAWQDIVSDHIMNKEIEKYHVVVTDEELFTFLRMYPPKEVQTFPQFMTDGKFDYQKYTNAMVNPDNAPFWNQIEAYVLPDLKKYKLQEIIINTIRTTAAEVQEAFIANAEKVNIGYINILDGTVEPFAKQATEEELKAFYDEHREDYKVPEKATIDIVAFEKAPSENDWARVEYIIKDVYDSAMAGADFAELARTYSEDNSAASGGDLGWFAKGRMVPEFDSVAWNLKVDEISKPFRTKFGWHIVKLLGRKTEKETPRGSDKPEMVEKIDAAHILLKVEPSDETLQQLLTNARDFIQSAKEMGFSKAAEDYNYKVQSTPPFTQNSYIQPYIGINKEVTDFVFHNDSGKVGDVVDTRDAYCVYVTGKRTPESYTSYEDAKATVTRMMQKEKGQELAYDTALTIRDAVVSGMTFKQAGEKYGFEYKVAENITRRSSIPGVGSSPEVLGTAFAMNSPNSISKPVKYDRGTVVLTLLDRISPSLDQFNAVKDSIQTAVLQKKDQDVFNRWFNGLVENAKIVNNVNRFYRNY